MLSDVQKAARRGRITSSVVAAALDLDEWSSPFDAQQRIKGFDTFAGNEATRRGDLLEPACLQFAAEETGMTLAPAPFVAHEDWSGDSTDALLLDSAGEVRALVEAKTVSIHAVGQAWGEPYTDAVPDRVLVQCHWHLLHHPQAEVCYVPVLFGGEFVFRLYVVERDAQFSAHLRTKAKAWHDRYIKGDQAPPVGGNRADTMALLKKAPRDWDAMLPCDDKLAALITERIEADKVLKAADKEQLRISNMLREAIGEHEGIQAAEVGYSVTYRKSADSTKVDWMQVARELGASEELITRHTKIEPGARVLRVAKKRVGKSPAKQEDS